MVLAMVRQGYNSGYAMRRQMQAMRGCRWSAESGSVYRVLRRLQEDNHVVAARKVGVPNRERTEYELTPSGEVLVDRWLFDPPAHSDLDLLTDSLRTRAMFLMNVDSKKRAQIVRGWIAENKRLISELEAEAGSSTEDQPQHWVCTNILSLAKARQDWLKKLSGWIK